MLAGCGGSSGGSKAPVATASDAAAQARAACKAVTSLKPVKDQTQYTKDTAAAFAKAAGIALKASRTDPRWTALADAADQEAKAFAIIAAATDGAATLDSQGVLGAAAQTRALKPIFIAQCQKAEGTTPSPTPTATP